MASDGQEVYTRPTSDRSSVRYLRLTPDQIAERWDTIKPVLCDSLPFNITNCDQAMTNIYHALLVDRMQLWCAIEGENVLVMCSTLVLTDPATLGRTLLIYTLTSVAGLSFNVLSTGLDVLEAFAKANECMNMALYTDNEQLVAALGRYRYVVRTSFAAMEVRS